MDNDTIKRILQYSGLLVFLIGPFVFWKFNIEVKSFKALTTCFSILSGIVIWWTCYFSFLWKWKGFRRILYKENLNGTWLGEYNSNSLTDGKVYQGEIVIVIRQNFLNLNVKSFTEQYINYSFGEAVNYDSKSESHQLVYLYSQSQFKPIDDNIRKGASELKLLMEPNELKLFGSFWTNHNSKGTLSLKRISEIHCTSFKEAKNLQK